MIEDMATNSGYVVFGAFVGAVVKIILQGEYTWRAFWSAVASIILGSATTILIVHIYPSLGADPVVVSSLSSIVTAVSAGIFRRVQKAQIKASVAGVEVNSNGEDQ